MSSGKYGILLIAHGARSEEWKEPVLVQKSLVKDVFERENLPFITETCFLEYEPYINDKIMIMERQGVDSILAFPLFIARSKHVTFDIPTVLGLKDDNVNKNRMKESRIPVYRGNTEIKLMEPLTEIIPEISLKMIKELTGNKKGEDILILAHGSEDMLHAWENLTERTEEHLREYLDISGFDHLFIKAGSNFSKNAHRFFLQRINNNNILNIIALFVSRSAEWLFNKYIDALPEEVHGRIKSGQIKLSKRSILPDPVVTDMIIRSAKEYLTKQSLL